MYLISLVFNSTAFLQFATAGFDQHITVWDADNLSDVMTLDEVESIESQSIQRKKQKTNKGDISTVVPTLTPLFTLTSTHTQSINGLVWPHPSILYTISDDGTLVAQSIEKQILLQRWTVRHQSLNCLDYSEELNVLAVGSNDCKIRLYDPRTKEDNHSNESQQIFKSHTNTVSSVKFHPTITHQFASVSFDQSVKLWDLRSNLPLSTKNQHSQRLFTCEWIGSEVDETQSVLVSGGADKQLRYQHWKTK
jgi:ribosome biogenesis protein YTM1